MGNNNPQSKDKKTLEQKNAKLQPSINESVQKNEQTHKSSFKEFSKPHNER